MSAVLVHYSFKMTSPLEKNNVTVTSLKEKLTETINK